MEKDDNNKVFFSAEDDLSVLIVFIIITVLTLILGSAVQGIPKGLIKGIIIFCGCMETISSLNVIRATISYIKEKKLLKNASQDELNLENVYAKTEEKVKEKTLNKNIKVNNYVNNVEIDKIEKQKQKVLKR